MNSKPDGVYEEFHINGNLKLRENYKDGKLDGLREKFYGDGQLLSQENYKNGELIGVTRTFYEKGELQSKSWQDDNLKTIEIYYKNGRIKKKIKSFTDGKKWYIEEFNELGALKKRTDFLYERTWGFGPRGIDAVAEIYDENGIQKMRITHKGIVKVVNVFRYRNGEKELNKDVFERNWEGSICLKEAYIEELRAKAKGNWEYIKYLAERYLPLLLYIVVVIIVLLVKLVLTIVS